MRFKVPQNIDMPDRILGPLTLVQFVYAIIGGGAAYICLQTLPKPISYFPAALIAMFTVAVIFVKVNERPFTKFLLSFIQYMAKPRSRIWHKDGGSNFEIEIYTPQKKEDVHVEHKEIDHRKVEDLAKTLDEGSMKIKV